MHKKLPSGEHAEAVKQLIASPDEASRTAGIRLAGAWKVATLKAEVRQALQQATSANTRQAAIASAATLEGREGLPLIASFATVEQPAEVQAAAVTAVSSIDVPAAAELAAALIHKAPNETHVSQLISPLLGRRGGSDALAKALTKPELTADSAKLVHRA